MKINNSQIYGWTNIALWMIKIGIWAIPFLPLYISSSMLFPFITGKNFAFRIIVEIIFALWAGLAVARAEYRPKLTPLLKAVTVFITVLFLADLFSPNPSRSFFSNYERMEGFMMLFHLYLYFVMMLSVFKTRKDWLIFLHSTLFASLAVSFVGLLQRFGYRISLQGGFRVDSTIGNPTYLAAYLLFHIWMLVFLLKEFWKKWWLIAIYSAALFFELLILYFTATRGAVLALLLVAILFWAAVVIFWQRLFIVKENLSIVSPKNNLKTWSVPRKLALAALLFILVTPIFFWQIRQTKFVQDTNILKRLVNYSLSERTIQSRFLIWRMSAKAFLDRPVLGWGQENYYLAFQKYYDPGLYAQEPWFDRSHNFFFDWLIHAGIVGLLSFLSILFVTFYYIKKALAHVKFPLWQGMVIVAMFLTHLLQNIFVFDNLNTYLLFFAFLAYTEWFTHPYFSAIRQADSGEQSRITNLASLRDENGLNSASLNGGGFIAAIILLITVFSLGYFLNLRPMKESAGLIDALTIAQTRGVTIDQITEAFKNTLNYKTFGDTEVREQMANFARNVPGSNNYSLADQKKFIEFAAEEFRKETTNSAKDVKHMLFLASILSRAQQFSPQYAQEAEKLLTDAVLLSPTKQIIQFELAQLYLSQGRTNEALEVLKRVVGLEPKFAQAKLNLLIVASLADRREIVEEVLKLGINLRDLDEDALKRLGRVFLNQKLYVGARDVYLQLADMFPTKAEYRVTLSAVLGELGEYDRAIEEAKKAGELDDSFKADSEAFIEIIRKGRGQ